MPKCRKCGKEIIFIKTSAGKSMPCDAEQVMYWADKKGKQRVVTPNGEVVACRLDGDSQEATGIGYIPHWGTCPNAKDFKRKG